MIIIHVAIRYKMAALCIFRELKSCSHRLIFLQAYLGNMGNYWGTNPWWQNRRVNNELLMQNPEQHQGYLV